MSGQNAFVRYKHEEYLTSPHSACPGCSIPLALRYFLRGMGEKVVFVIPPGCSSVIVNIPQRRTVYRGALIAALACPFGSAVTYASGIKTALNVKGDDETQVVAWAGDGATFDIGLGAISAAAERNEDIIYVCYDNEAYQNTGNQRSSASPPLSINATNFVGMPKNELKKDIDSIMAAHRIPYLATVSIAYPDDFIRKVFEAKTRRGFRFLHVLIPCPTGWRFPASQTIKVARLAVEARIFPLFEVEHGSTFIINKKPKRHIPVRDYLRIQGRFNSFNKEKEKNLQEQEKRIQALVDERWKALLEISRSDE